MNAEEAIDRTREVIRRQHKARTTEASYLSWLRRYMAAIPHYPASFTSEQKLERFLSDLARDRDISASSQNQAFNAVLFFYGMFWDVPSKGWMPCGPANRHG